MRINHNIASLNTYRQLSANSANGSRSLEKLSSGLRINKAGDDAAGLAISEKMRGQIRGLDMASKNAQDGISLIQTAEGALNETHSILQRMRELAVQSATDTNTDTDRAELQKEVDQLSEELTRIADNTEFNTQKLLDGSFKGTFQIGANSGQNISIEINKMDASTLGVEGAKGVKTDVTSARISAVASDETGVTADTTEIFGAFGNSSGVITHAAAPTTVTVDKLDTAVSITDGANTVKAQYAMFNQDGQVLAVSEDGNQYTVLTSATAESALAANTDLLESAADTLVKIDFGTNVTVTSGEVTMTFTDAAANAADELSFTAKEAVVAFTSENSNLKSGSYEVINDTHPLVDVGDVGLVDESGNVVATSNDGLAWTDLFGNALFTVPTQADSDGSNPLAAGDKFTVSSSGGIDISSQTSADKAIETIQSAIDSVSTERSKLGAYQNRLEHTINNLGTSAENLTAAESRIRDVDMAKEMMEFTKNNILSQAAQAMLAQANQQPQGVLQLLR